MSLAGRLERHVRHLAEACRPRDYTHPANLDASAAYIAAAFASAGGIAVEQPYDVQGVTYRNVCCRFGPPGTARVIIGAHYDAAGHGPAADDNASGVAAVLELARVFAAEPPGGAVELVAYSLEEPPFFGTRHQGSAVHAAALRREGVRVRAMLALEMIGFFSDLPESQELPLPVLRTMYPTTGNFIAVAGRFREGLLVRRIVRAMRGASPLPVEGIAAPRSLPGIALSDNASYWDAGFDAVMITDTAFFRNPHYHTAHDTPDTLDYARMADVVRGVRAAVLRLAARR